MGRWKHPGWLVLSSRFCLGTTHHSNIPTTTTTKNYCPSISDPASSTIIDLDSKPLSPPHTHIPPTSQFATIFTLFLASIHSLFTFTTPKISHFVNDSSLPLTLSHRPSKLGDSLLFNGHFDFFPFLTLCLNCRYASTCGVLRCKFINNSFS